MFEFSENQKPDTAKPLSKKEQAQHKNEVYLLRATVSDWEARVRNHPYREFVIRGNQTLDDLASTILNYFRFDHDHLYGFYNNLKRWAKATEAYSLCIDDNYNNQCTHEIIVAQVFNQPKKKMLFLFDYGDEWRFIVQLKEVQEAEKGKTYPLLLKSVGNAPSQYGDYEDDDYDEDDEF